MQILFSGEVDDGYNIQLSGDFDAHGCKQVREQLESIIESCVSKNISIDLHQVSFIDSSGLGAIVFLFKRIRAIDGNLKITRVTGQPMELLKLLRVDEVIPVEWSSPEGCADTETRH